MRFRFGCFLLGVMIPFMSGLSTGVCIVIVRRAGVESRAVDTPVYRVYHPDASDNKSNSRPVQWFQLF
jgi:hypothetical protein